MVIYYDKNCYFRSIFMNTGDYKSSDGPYPDEISCVYPRYDSGNSNTEQVTMQYLGHDPASSRAGYERFRLTITNANSAFGNPDPKKRITDIFIDYGKNYPYSHPPVLLTDIGTVDTSIVKHIRFLTSPLNDISNPESERGQLVNDGESINLTFSFYPYSGSNSTNYTPTHAIAVLIQDGYGYRTFGHYAVAYDMGKFDLELGSTLVRASNDGGATWPAISSSGVFPNIYYLLPWLKPINQNTIKNIYSLTLPVRAQITSRFRVGLKDSLHALTTDPFVAVCDQDYPASSGSLILPAIKLYTEGSGANLNPRDETRTFWIFFVAPVFGSTPPTSINTNGWRNNTNTDPTMIRDWYSDTIC